MASAWPTGDELQTYVSGLGVLDDASVIPITEYDAKALAAVEAFERATGYEPFLAGTATKRYFDPPGHDTRGQTRGGGRELDLRGGLVTLTTLKTGYSTTSAGTALTVNVDFFFHPRNAAQGWPYTGIEFVESQWGDPRSIEIDGTWGFAATIPDDAYAAVLAQAALGLKPQIDARKSGGLKQYETVGLKVVYGGLDELAKEWRREFRTAATRYRRVTL